MPPPPPDFPPNEKKAMMGALADDQRAIESVLEGERIRVEENLRTATAARKAREDMHAVEDAAEERCVHLSQQYQAGRALHSQSYLVVFCSKTIFGTTLSRYIRNLYYILI